MNPGFVNAVSDIRAVSERARVLKAYLSEHLYFTPEEDLDNEDAEGTELMVCLCLGVAPYEGKVHIEFEYGSAVDLSKHDPQKAAKACVEALKEAVPEVQAFGVAFEVRPQELA